MQSHFEWFSLFVGKKIHRTLMFSRSTDYAMPPKNCTSVRIVMKRLFGEPVSMRIWKKHIQVHGWVLHQIIWFWFTALPSAPIKPGIILAWPKCWLWSKNWVEKMRSRCQGEMCKKYKYFGKVGDKNDCMLSKNGLVFIQYSLENELAPPCETSIRLYGHKTN